MHWSQLLETTRDYSVYVAGFIPSFPPFGPFPSLAIANLAHSSPIWAANGFLLTAAVGAVAVSTLVDPAVNSQYAIWWLRRRSRHVELGWRFVKTYVADLPLVGSEPPGCVGFGRIEVSAGGPLVREVMIFNAETPGSLHNDVIAYLASRYG